jgi:hypothetical protein
MQRLPDLLAALLEIRQTLTKLSVRPGIFVEDNGNVLL